MKYMARRFLVFVLASMGVLHAATPSDAQSAVGDSVPAAELTRILGNMEYLRGFKGTGFNFTAEAVTVDNGKTSKPHLLDVKISDKGYALIEVLSPLNERGQRTLLRDRDLWLYLPNSSNIIRIAPLQRVFGDASVADVLNVSYLHGYTVQSSSRSDHVLHMSLKSISDTSTFARIDVDYDLSTDRPIETRHYAISGRLLKTIQYKSFHEYGGVPKLEKIAIYDDIRTTSAVWMKMSEYVKADYPDSLFTKTMLSKK
jgi:hypothetical protein